MKSEKEKRKINTEDGWNRTFFGNPTISGFINSNHIYSLSDDILLI